MSGSRSHDFAGLQHDFARVKRLAGGMSWAHARATTTHGAGIGVKQLFPCEVFDNSGTERLE